MTERSAFAGGDQSYLRDEQYGDGSKLGVRVAMHRLYSRASATFPDFEAALVEWPDGAEVLECGAGTGGFWDTTLVPKTARLTLSDLSPGMVAEATAKATTAGYARVTGRECDVQELPFADGSFDVVMANHILYHVPDADQAVAELARVVRPGGVVLAATNGHGHMGEMKAAVEAVFGEYDESLYDVFGIESGEARVREHFREVVWHAYDNDLFVTDPQAAVDYGLSYPPGESANEQQAAAFAAHIDRCFGGGQMRIRTRAGVFVCRQPRAAGSAAT